MIREPLGSGSVHSRYQQKYHEYPGGNDSDLEDPKFAKTHGNSYPQKAMVWYANNKKFLFVALAFAVVYFIGYSNGSTFKQPFYLSDIEERTSDVKSLEDNLEAVEHMLGFSEAYPKYDETVSDVQAQVNEFEEMDDVEGEYSADDENENDLFRPVEEPVKRIITSDFTDEELFSNYDEYKKASYVTVPNLSTKYNLPYNLPKKKLWWALKIYEKQYRTYPIKSVVPRLKRNVQLTVDEFHERFRKPGVAVVFSFENLRNLGFQTQNYTLDQLKLMFPFDEKASTAQVQKQFVANGIRKDDEMLDLGPGLVAIERDEELAKKGKLRSFPRNLKVKTEAIERLNVQKPPLLKGDKPGLENWQLPTVWMGTSSSDTRFHHDCCDNFVMMISGTKRFTLAPTSDWRILNPQCIGKLKNLCWANVNDPNQRVPGANKKSSEAALKYINKMIVDVGPGDILYMPSGWFHHIQNLGPTLMVNWWTKGQETCAVMRANKSPSY